MTPEQIITFEPAAAWCAQALVDACGYFAIVEPREQAMFLAQTAHESNGFAPLMRELWGPTPQQAAYAQRADLGNTLPEAIAFAHAKGVDVGRFYSGHAAIQITGYLNTLAYSMFRYGDERCAADPTILMRLPDCIWAAAWFWVTRGCQKLAPPYDLAAFDAVTQRINGGQNGRPDRLARWANAKLALGVQP